MAITPTQILRISEPVERMYNDCTSQLLINLCAHFASGKEMELAEWEMKKMSELGTLTQESVAIIARNTGQSPEAIYKAISGALDIELGDVEKTLSRAAQRGTIQSPGISWQASENVKTVVQNLSGQAVDDMNIVNTTMLRSTQQRYTAAVQYAVSEETAIIEHLQGMTSGASLAGQLEKSQRALNKAAMSVATGAETRTEALRRTIDWLGKQGITGYVDSAGRQWTPEAYVNMNIRTTVHNAAVQGQKARSEDYGVRTFQISSHGGARPLCAPYQGKFYSWDAGDSGTVYDIDGNGYHYESIYSTSYGQAAGIFGINCGHSPQTFVNGYSIPRYEPTRDPEENAREYQLMQQQRYMERRVRSSETQALCYKAAGDKEAFSEASVRVVGQREQYKMFCKENDLTPRLDRTWVSGYNKSAERAVNRTAQKSHESWLHSIGADTTNLQKLSDYYQAKYNRAPDYTLLRGYANAVKRGDISSLIGLDLYKEVSDSIQENLVGMIASDGTKVSGYTTHFIDRVIGQTSTPHKGMRMGVTVEQALDALQNPTNVVPEFVNGEHRKVYAGSAAKVTMNAEGQMIQANPWGAKP